jgi:hypothetical protein
LENGSKRIFAASTEWPGWARAGKTATAALEALTDYASRYGKVAELAKVPFDQAWFLRWKVVEEVAGDGATDFGVPHRVVTSDRRALGGSTARKWADLLSASWTYLDEVSTAAPATLRKGPRGGGRDRDAVLRHVEDAEESYGASIGISRKLDPKARRREIVDLVVTGSDGNPVREKGWPLRYAVRRIAWHVLDHVWEIEDRSK